MASTRYDLTVAREYTANGQTKTAWTRIGTAFPNREGGGFTLNFDALPLGGKVSMFVHKDQNDQQAPRKSRDEDEPGW